MLQHRGFSVIFIGLGLSCSSANVKRESLFSRQIFDQPKESIEETSQVPSPIIVKSEDATIPIPKEEKTAEETVSPPGNISGSYLICVEMKAPTAASPESTTTCAVRNQKTNNKVDLGAQFTNVEWSYQLAGSSNLNITQTPLSTSPEWHVSITLKAATLEQVQAQRNALRIVITVQNAAGVKLQEIAPVSANIMRWLPLDGGRVPTNAAVGGTEHDGADNLYLCRVYSGADVIPGKLIVHYNDPNKSICYATSGNTALTSHSDDAQTLLLRSDVLVINLGTFDNYFEWVPAMAGQKPANALVTGIDANGNPLYACRGLQVADLQPEQTPGVLRPGTIGCSYEYYGANLVPNYQVLSWKETATQIMMDSRTLPPP